MTMLVQAPTAIEQGELATLNDNQVEHYDDVPVQADIVLDNTKLLFKSKYDPLHPNMPYLHIQGHVTQLSGNIPYTSGNVSFRDDDVHHAPKVDMFYHFNKNQLKQLVDKGLYDKGFAVPKDLKSSALEMNDIPLNCSLAIIKPNEKTNVPLIFSQIKNNGKIKIDLASTQYDLAGIFKTAQEQILADAKEKQKQAADEATEKQDVQEKTVAPSDAISFDDIKDDQADLTFAEQPTQPQAIDSEQLGDDVLSFGEDEPDEDLTDQADDQDETELTENEESQPDLPNSEKEQDESKKVQATQSTTPEQKAAHDLVAKAKARLEANRKKRQQVETMLNNDDQDGDGIDDDQEEHKRIDDTDFDNDGTSDYEEDHDQEERPEENPNNGLFDTDDFKLSQDEDEDELSDPEAQATDPKHLEAIRQAETANEQADLEAQANSGDADDDKNGDGLNDEEEDKLDSAKKKKLVKKALARLAQKRHKNTVRKPAQPTHYQNVTSPATISKTDAAKNSFHL